jgi:hypothetical protein
MRRKAFTRQVVTRSTILLLALAGCGGSDTTAPTTEAGTYNVVGVNGQNVPFTLTGTLKGTVVIQGGSIVLTLNGSSGQYAASVTGTANGQGPQQLVADAGTYVKTGGTLTFSSVLAPGVQYVASLTGSDLSVALPGALFGTASTITILLRRS